MLVSLTLRGAVAELRLRRPAALNALDPSVAREFSAAVRRLRSSAARVAVLSGEGPAFCAGGDLAFIEVNRRLTPGKLEVRMRRFYGAFLSLRDLPQATVAKVHGAAVGAGLCLALACDLRVVEDEARLAFNFVRLGLSPGMGAWPLARAALGAERARELLMTGRAFRGRDLHAWGGAARRAAGPKALDRACGELSGELAAASPASLRALKRETRLGEDLEESLRFEARAQSRTFRGPDLAEGLRALRERRAPRFS